MLIGQLKKPQNSKCQALIFWTQYITSYIWRNASYSCLQVFAWGIIAKQVVKYGTTITNVHGHTYMNVCKYTKAYISVCMCI